MADDSDIGVNVTADTADVTSKLGGLKDSISSLKEPLQNISDFAQHVGEVFGIAFSLDKFKDFITGMADLGEQTQRTADIFGTTTQQIGLLNYAATLTGGSGEELTRSLERMSIALEDTSGHATPAGAAIKALGLDAKDLANLPLPQLLDTLRDKFDQLPAGYERIAIAQTLARNGAESILPILSMSSDAWQDLKTKFEETGSALDGPTAAAFANTSDRFTTLGAAMTGLGERVFKLLEPAIDAVTDALTRFIEGLDAPKIDAAFQMISNTAITVFQAVVSAAIQAEGAVAGLVIRMSELGGLAKSVGEIALGQMTVNPGEIVQGVAGLFTGPGSADKLLATMNINIQSQLDSSTKMFQSWRDNVSAIVSGGFANSSGSPDDRQGPPAPPKGKNFNFDLGGSNAAAALEADKQAYEGEIQQSEKAKAAKIADLNDELQQHRITDAQWVASSKAALDEAYNEEHAYLEKENALQGLRPAEHQLINNKLKLLDQDYANDVSKINRKAADDASKSWADSLKSIAQAINSQLSGLINGTETWGQALANVLEGFAEKGIEALENLAIQWITTQTATQTAQQASDAAKVTADAAVAYAGTVANLAPSLGPAALAPAAAVEASVLATALPSLDVGTYGIPDDMPINAHKGETIIPAFESGQFRDAMAALAGGKGVGATHIHNWNGPVMDQVGLARAVARVFNSNPSTRPKY